MMSGQDLIDSATGYFTNFTFGLEHLIIAIVLAAGLLYLIKKGLIRKVIEYILIRLIAWAVILGVLFYAAGRFGLI